MSPEDRPATGGSEHDHVHEQDHAHADGHEHDQAGQHDVALPALLRAARNTYGSAMRAAMAEVDCDDVPRNGIYVLGGIARTGSPLSQIIRELRLSKQAAGQLVDTLVARGYLDRSPDPVDRRRTTVSLTERGACAAEAARSAARLVDEELLVRVGADHVANTRLTLAALIDIGEEAESG